MEPKKELAIIRYALIALLVASTGGLVIWGFFVNTTSSTKTGYNAPNWVEVESGFGKIRLYESDQTAKDFSSIGNDLTYVDNVLGFEISRPNLKWNFDTNIDDVLGSAAISNKKFVGGLYLSKNNEKTFFVGVFDITQYDKFNLADYVKTQINTMTDSRDTKIIVNKVSPTNNWSIFGAKITLENKTSIYGEQILEIHNDKLYMLQYVGMPPDLVDIQTKEDIRKIIDSFKPFN
ncbi:MAG: hypothetical protein ACREAE_01420 [Nitrosopumilaceae archaeon]